MEIRDLFTLLASISSLFLGVLVLFRYRRNIRALFLTFVFFALFVSAWAYVNFHFWVFNDGLFTFRLQYALGGASLTVGVIWILYFVQSKVSILKILLVSLLGFIVFLAPITSNLVIKGIRFDIIAKSYDFDIGQLFNVYSLLLLLLLGYLLFLVAYERKHAQGVKKVQFSYILFGLSSFAFISVLFGLILPFFHSPKVVPYDSQSSIIWVAFAFYAITRHKLFDIRFVILRTLSYSILLFFITATIVGLTLLLPERLGVSTTTKTFIAVVVSVFLVLILDPLRRFIANVTDRLFYKKRIDYQKLFSVLSEIINREIDLTKLTQEIEGDLTKELKISYVSVYVAPTRKGDFSIQNLRRHSTGSIKRPSPLVEYLLTSKRIVVLEALERKIEDTTDEKERATLEASKAQLDQLDASVVSPVFVENNVNAVIVLGHKLSGDPFGDEDVNLLELLGPQLASAIVKSQLYDQIKQFNVQLQKEINIATHDLQSANTQLQERNRFLSAIQTVTTLMSKSLDLKKVTQDIVDSIASEMGYLGGLLIFLGKDRRKLFPEAMTQNRLTSQIFHILPKPLSEYWGWYDKDDTRNIRAMKQNKVEIGGRLSEFLDPPLPAEIADEIQRVLKIKAVIAVPIVSEGQAVGVINYILDKDPGDLRETDLQMMRALANQTGIVYRNIELYRQIEESNKELGEANEHLKELDQAKSEFVSIASHQLRTPMTGIMGYISMLVSGDFGKMKKDQLQILQSLLEESKRMISLIRIFLDVSKIESGTLVLKKSPTHMEDVIGKAITVLAKAAADKKLKLIFTKPAKPLPEIFMDQEKMSDVVMNLIDNAVKYTDKGSITLGAKVENDLLHVWVKDTGIGIEPHEAKGLFNKFVRGYGIAQINPDGSGLGLYVARRLTEAHDGKIWVESQGTGKGSTFQFSIPIKQAPDSGEAIEEHVQYVRQNR